MPADSSFTIMSFVVAAGGEGFDGDIEEATNTGVGFTPRVRFIISKLRPGSFVEFSCIKAKHTNGMTYILQPLFFELK